MRTLLICGLMFAVMTAFTATTTSPALAQPAKKDAKKDKDTKKGVTKSGAGTIEIGEGKDGKFRFFVRNADGKLLAMSGPGGFATAKDAEEAIDDLKEVVAKAKVTRAAVKKVKPKD